MGSEERDRLLRREGKEILGREEREEIGERQRETDNILREG